MANGHDPIRYLWVKTRIPGIAKAALFMADSRINRKLAAILVADVVGYSRLMEADEAGTLGALKRHRETIFDPAVAAHNGRVVKLIGDGAIVEFGSVVDAVNCAVSVQRSSPSSPDAAMRQSTIVLRIGINLGDIIIENDDIYGDGVNIAARLEPLAEPGGIASRRSFMKASVIGSTFVSKMAARSGSRTSIGRSESGSGILIKQMSSPMPLLQRPKSRGPRSPFCPSPTCRAMPNRSIFPMASVKT